MHRHELKGGLPDLEPLPGFEHELGQTLAVVPSAVRATDVSDPNLVALEMDLRVSTRGLWIVEDDVSGLTTNGRDRSTDVARLGWSIDVLDLEDVVAAHSRLRMGEARVSQRMAVFASTIRRPGRTWRKGWDVDARKLTRSAAVVECRPKR